MQTTNRPLSPHLQIYRWQLTSVLSITHRATGILLAVGTVLLAYWISALAAGPEAFGAAQRLFGSWWGELLLFGCTYALFFHLCNGIRHLFWDMGLGLELARAYRSGAVVVIASAALTVLAWLVGLIAAGAG
jgi:succinate dehydrogenase / fumarate reductase cytochrome b subunit